MDHAVEAFAHRVGAVLAAGDFDVAVAGEGRAHGEERNLAVEGQVHAGREETGLEAGGAEHGLLGERHTLQGELLLGIFGPVEGDEVFGEMGDLIDILDAYDGEGGGGEAVDSGVLGGSGFAFRSAGPSAFRGVQAIGGELFV